MLGGFVSSTQTVSPGQGNCNWGTTSIWLASSIFLTDDWCSRVQFTVGDVTPKDYDLAYRQMKAGKGMERKPVRNFPPWFLLLLLLDPQWWMCLGCINQINPFLFNLLMINVLSQQQKLKTCPIHFWAVPIWNHLYEITFFLLSRNVCDLYLHFSYSIDSFKLYLRIVSHIYWSVNSLRENLYVT